jgi:integrase
MPPRKAGPRRTIAPNVYEDDIGISAIARVGSRKPVERRFKKGTPLKEITNWLEAERTKLRGQKARILAMRGTLGGDVLAYLAHLPAGRAKDNTRWDLTAWLAVLGTKRRDKITVDDLRRVVNGWLEAKVPASTINHRRRALAQLYEALDGADAPNPVRQIKRAKEVLPEPTAYPMDVLTAIIDGMDAKRGVYRKGESSHRRSNKSQARLRLLLWSGMPPASLRALQPRRVSHDLQSGHLWYPPRGKGAGAAAVLLPLFPEGVTSVTKWLYAGAWGSFSEASLRHALRRAAKSYAKREADTGRSSSPVPSTITPYHLRHSFLTWLYETTGDPYLVQLYGQHADLETTQRYTRKGVPARARDAVARVAGFHGAFPQVSGKGR